MPGNQPNFPEEETDTSEAPTKSARRWVVLALIFSITVINFIDRQTLSVLAPVLRVSYHLSNEAYGRIVAALQFGMMSSEFPMGWLMDRIGARLGLTAAVLWWSAATGSQVFTRTGFQLGATRLWMGTGEAGNYPGGMKAVSRFFSRGQRTLAIGIFNSGSMIGATVAPPLIVFLMQRYGFRAAFVVPALLGAIWVPLWWYVYPHHKASALLEEGSTQIPVSALLKQSSAWAVMMCRFLIGPVMQFYWYWIPSYLYSVRHMSLTQIGVLGWIPFFLGNSGGVFGGWAAGWLQKRKLNIYTVRQITMYGSSLLCVTSLIVPYLHNAVPALLMIGIAVMADNFLSANMFGAITDLFPDHLVGRATGLTGVSGGLSGLLFPLLTGILVDHVSYKPVFIMVAFMPLLGTLALFILGKKYRTGELDSPAANG
ncbi:MAG: MFS transporter [Acidobacteriaceae bacterium]